MCERLSLCHADVHTTLKPAPAGRFGGIADGDDRTAGDRDARRNRRPVALRLCDGRLTLSARSSRCWRNWIRGKRRRLDRVATVIAGLGFIRKKFEGIRSDITDLRERMEKLEGKVDVLTAVFLDTARPLPFKTREA